VTADPAEVTCKHCIAVSVPLPVLAMSKAERKRFVDDLRAKRKLQQVVHARLDAEREAREVVHVEQYRTLVEEFGVDHVKKLGYGAPFAEVGDRIIRFDRAGVRHEVSTADDDEEEVAPAPVKLDGNDIAEIVADDESTQSAWQKIVAKTRPA
jgi:hypothetical protein